MRPDPAMAQAPRRHACHAGMARCRHCEELLRRRNPVARIASGRIEGSRAPGPRTPLLPALDCHVARAPRNDAAGHMTPPYDIAPHPSLSSGTAAAAIKIAAMLRAVSGSFSQATAMTSAKTALVSRRAEAGAMGARL